MWVPPPCSRFPASSKGSSARPTPPATKFHASSVLGSRASPAKVPLRSRHARREPRPAQTKWKFNLVISPKAPDFPDNRHTPRPDPATNNRTTCPILPADRRVWVLQLKIGRANMTRLVRSK